jgi:hypothetical protein
VRKSFGKLPLGIQRRRWYDNIKKDLTEVSYGAEKWFKLVHRGVNVWCWNFGFFWMELHNNVQEFPT